MLLKTRNFFVRCCLPTLRLEEVHDLFGGVRDTVRFPPSQTARLRFGYGVGDFNSNRLGINAQYPACSCLCRDLVVTACALYSARKVPPEPCGCCELLVVVVVVVGPYFTVTGNGARWFHGSTQRDDVGRSNSVVAHIAVPLFAVACTGAANVPLFRATLPLYSAVMLPLTKAPLLLRVNIPLVMRLQAKVKWSRESFS